jgi:hypothetical protein
MVTTSQVVCEASFCETLLIVVLVMRHTRYLYYSTFILNLFSQTLLLWEQHFPLPEDKFVFIST